MTGFADDLRFALRHLRRTPAFAVMTAVTLALGIGANVAVFTVVDPLLLRQLPVPEPEELVLLHSTGSRGPVDISERAAFEQYSNEKIHLAGVLADAGMFEFQILYRGRRTSAMGEIVSGSYFPVLGIAPRFGRLLAQTDEASSDAIVLSSAYWTRAFGGDRSVIGDTIAINGRPHTIVGVAPVGFFGITVGSMPDFYAPFGSALRPPVWVRVVARLPSGVSAPQAREALAPVFARVTDLSPLPDVTKTEGMERLLVTPAGRGLSELRQAFGVHAWVLTTVVALVLLVASTNVAQLMLARTAGRRQEASIQLALGATPARLVRQLTLEAAVIACVGATAGVAFAQWGSRALIAGLETGRAQVTLGFGLNTRVALFSIAILCLTVLLCAVVPALASRRFARTNGFALRGHGLERGTRPSRLRQALIAAQIAASVTLLITTGLLVRSLVNLYAVDVGFSPERVLTFTLVDRGPNRPAGNADVVLASLIDAARQQPGVEAAAFANQAPLTAREIGINVVAHRAPLAAPTQAMFTSVTPGYFETLGIPMIAGRGCSAEDTPDSLPAVVVNSQLARRLFGDANPLGRYLRFVEGRRPPLMVIGVAAPAVYNNVREESRSFLYLCRQQQTATRAGGVLFVRSRGGGADHLAPSVQQLIRSIAPDVDVTATRTLRNYLSESLQKDRVTAGLLAGFTAVALLVAAVGLYGMLSGIVARQTREIGLRVALGAGKQQIALFAAGPMAMVTGIGLLLGTLGAMACSPLLESLLFGLDTSDALTYSVVLVTMAATAVAACYAPVRRALRIEPMAALRGD